MGEKRLDTTYRFKNEKNREAKEAARADMTKTHFKEIERVNMGSRVHSLWTATVNGGSAHDLYVACIGHPPEQPEYTRAFIDRHEAFDFFSKFKGASI